jgi:ribosome biogenesis GTPase / thiamine phosphate phosphatase
MTLRALGWNDDLQRELEALGRPELVPARVAVEHRILYRVMSAHGTDSVELSGRLRRQAEALERPAVGDWVAVHEGRIEAVLPRRSVFVRKAGRERPGAQVVAANIDTVFIVAAATRELDLRLTERYLEAVQQSGAKPVLVLNKIDACPSPEPLLPLAELMKSGLPVVCVSALLRQGREVLASHIGQGTAALVGLSGAGKTSIANWLLGRDDLVTGEVSARDGQGKHTTSHRELYLLPEGGVLIDTPGMRELGLWMTTAELGGSFPELAQLAKGCRFHDCQHVSEPGCNVRHAIETGALPPERFEHFLKLKRELVQLPTARGGKPRRH